jgi:hypothetical protein
VWFGSAERKKLEALIDELAGSYLRDDLSNSVRGRGEICRKMAEIADELRSAGDTKTIDRVRSYRPDIEIVLSREIRQQVRYLTARALEGA